MKDYLQTVTGPVAREDMGLTLPHEHLFNDLSSVVDAPCYPFSQQLVDKKVTAEIQWALKHDPYCCADNMDRKPIEDVIFEINNFISLGGRTIVDATGSESIGRDAQALREVALKTGLNIVASSGPYLEKFESQRIHKTVDELATTIDKELNQGIGDTDIRAGMIGEIGVSPTFTEAEHNSLRAASLAQINNPHVAMNIHMPGWLRRGDEVLDIVLGEMQEGNRLHYLADRAGIRGLFSDADAYHLDQAFPLLMKQLELMLTSGELNPRHQHTVTLYAKGLTCKADTLSSCGYVYLAVYPTPEMKN